MNSFLSWLLPPGASTFVREIDPIYYMILVITGVAFVLVEVALVWFLVRYRGRPGRRAHYTHGNNRAEVIWTAVTALVVVMIGLTSRGAWAHIKGRDSAPPGSYPIRVHVKQFEWIFTYPGPDGQLGNADDFTVRNQLHIPVNTPILAHLESEDVIHSFWIPAFRIKQDAVPGMHITAWFQPTQVGTFEIGCAELCGLGHYRMRGMVTVHSREDFDRWSAAQRARAAGTPGQQSQGQQGQ
jgi:cytochrome c oxidase subunit 2